MRRIWKHLAVSAVVAVSTALPVNAAHAAGGHYTGTLSDGSTWIADVPASWNGTLLLYSHGFGPLVAQDGPGAAATSALLDRGYALAGSSYAPGSLWALGSAVDDQLGTAQAVSQIIGRPRTTIAFGTSMGGLVSAKVAETGKVQGALTTCGIVAGGADLDNYQLNAGYALSELLAPGQNIQLTGFTSPAASGATGAALTQVVQDAQPTAAGKARIALASALLNQSDWYPGAAKPAPTDYAEQEAQQYSWLTSGSVLNFVMGARYFIELAAGGDSSGTVGVDYAALLHRSAHASEVRALYQAAGLDLRADLSTLVRNATIKPDRSALSWLLRTSVPTGRLRAPELDLHTISDQLVPVEQERQYALRVAAAGRSDLLRQAYVDRASHCNFSTAELVVGVQAVQRRIDTRHWSGVTPGQLNQAAAALGLDGSAFLPYRPSTLVTQRVP